MEKLLATFFKKYLQKQVRISVLTVNDKKLVILFLLTCDILKATC
jgi:hypothetical protein